MPNFNLVEFVNKQESVFESALCEQDVVKWDKEKQFAMQSFQKNNYLSDVAQKNPISAANAIVNIANIGITLNPAAKLAYLVPRDGGVCLDISYMGLIHLATSTGSIEWVQCKIVYSNDSYENNGVDVAPSHKYNSFGARGEVVGGYCVAKLSNSDYLTEEMSAEKINEVRDRSAGWIAYMNKRAKSCPWASDYEEMAKKTIVKRAYKYWPKVERLDNAVSHLNNPKVEGIDFSDNKTEILVNPEDSIAASCKEQKRTLEEFFEWVSKVAKRDVLKFEDMTESELQRFASKLEAKK